MSDRFKNKPKRRKKALLLAAGCGIWSWLYTYEKDKKKFWVGLLVPLTFLLISFASSVVYEPTSLETVFFLLSLFSIPAFWLLAIFYAAYRPKIWYEEYPDWRGIMYLDLIKKWYIIGILLVLVASVLFGQWMQAAGYGLPRWLGPVGIYLVIFLAPRLSYPIHRKRARGQARGIVKKLLGRDEVLHHFMPVSNCATIQRHPKIGRRPKNSRPQLFGAGLLGVTGKRLVFYETRRRTLRSFAYNDIDLINPYGYGFTNIGSVRLFTKEEEVVFVVIADPSSSPKGSLAFMSFIQNRIAISDATSRVGKGVAHNLLSQTKVVSFGVAIFIVFSLTFILVINSI